MAASVAVSFVPILTWRSKNQPTGHPGKLAPIVRKSKAYAVDNQFPTGLLWGRKMVQYPMLFFNISLPSLRIVLLLYILEFMPQFAVVGVFVHNLMSATSTRQHVPRRGDSAVENKCPIFVCWSVCTPSAARIWIPTAISKVLLLLLLLLVQIDSARQLGNLCLKVCLLRHP